MSASDPLHHPDAGAAVILVSNGPGELTTWVRPLALALQQRLPLRPAVPQAPLALHLVLVPCPNGTGREPEVARRWGLFERVVPAHRFWRLLLRPRTLAPWPRRGVVVFLGGDQFWTVLLSARLGYRHLTYAEWEARWPRWNDRLALMGPAAAGRLAPRWHARAQVVGDLIADLTQVPPQADQVLPVAAEWVALLPGSKRIKLQVGVPFFCAVADLLARQRPGCRFVIPLAPTITADDLLPFLDPASPIARHYGAQPARLVQDAGGTVLLTAAGTPIRLTTVHPAHQLLSQCRLALTTVGANTAELAALGVPMIVVVPTHHLDVMEAWDGLIGMVARWPGLGRLLGKAFTAWQLGRRGWLALPNIAAGRAVVPERVGLVTPEEIATEAADWLAQPQRLEAMRDDLRSLRGQPGAAAALAAMVEALLQPPTAPSP